MDGVGRSLSGGLGPTEVWSSASERRRTHSPKTSMLLLPMLDIDAFFVVSSQRILSNAFASLENWGLPHHIGDTSIDKTDGGIEGVEVGCLCVSRIGFYPHSGPDHPISILCIMIETRKLAYLLFAWCDLIG